MILSYTELTLDKEGTISVTTDADWCTVEDYYFDIPSTGFKLPITVADNMGEARTATITVRAGKSSASMTVTQDAYITGQNKIGGTIAEAVDLGLSVKWASHNLGASKQSESGVYLGWGLLEESKYYDNEHHPYYNKSYEAYTNIGENISGTKYDAASYHWGDGWRMPTEKELDELIYKCTWEWIQVDKINGYRITGPNGKQIFLPAWNHQFGDYNKINENKLIYIWSGTLSKADHKSAYMIYADSGTKHKSVQIRAEGLNIRPVK